MKMSIKMNELEINLENAFCRIKKIFCENKKVALFGAGKSGTFVADFITSNFSDAEIVAVIDTDTKLHGKTMQIASGNSQGINIISAAEYSKPYQKVPIIVTSDTYYYPIKKALLEQKINESKIFFIPQMIAEIFCDKKKQSELSQKIHKVYNVLEDEKSKNIFENLVRHKYLGEEIDLSAIATTDKPEYFDSEIIMHDPDVTYIDCGAYDGDSIKNFVTYSKGKYKEIIAIEPDKKTFEKICKYASPFKSKITLINKAVSDKMGKVHFENSGPGSRMQAEKNINILNKNVEIVETDKIDNICKGKDNLLIKMDIEGAELAALKGAGVTIKRCVPKLAICLYHKKEDYIEIPLYLKSICPEYQLKIRHYSANNLLETVLYATHPALGTSPKNSRR